MLCLLLIAIQLSLGNSKCDICVTQPLITSNIKCPICTTLDGQYTQEEEELPQASEDCSSTTCYTDANNPNNWTTCNVYAPACNANYKYRSFDGSCNNLEHPTWGMAGTAYARILPSNYRDRKHVIHLSVDGEELPLVRELSLNIFSNGSKPDAVTLMAMQWGQVVAHDIALTTLFPLRNCCDSSIYNEDECLTFEYSSKDPFFSKYGVTCDNFQRNRYIHVGSDCDDGPAQQIDNDSHPIDGSIVYGSDLERANSLRSFDGGRLTVRTLDDGREFLPNVPNVMEQCFAVSDTEPCYQGGDIRANQNPGISVLSNLLLRSHNNMATKLQDIHPKWDDEQVYQETRRIMAATLQHIHYREWLEFYVGKVAMKKYDLYPRLLGYTTYNSKINLLGINSFHAGAFRVAHSGIQGFLNMYDHYGQFTDSEPISDWMNRPLIVERGCNYDELLLGLVKQPMQKFDTVFTDQMTDLLLHGFKPYGTDLVSTDILRGRDNGLAPYVHYLEVCTGFKATTFDSLASFMPKRHIRLLKNNYRSIEDIDFIVGGSLETHVDGSRLGSTFLCLFVEQFYRIKWGDRFWYEVGGQPHSFTKDQLKEIRKMTVSKLICENSDQITEIPINSFLPESKSNPIKDCSDIPGIDLNKF